MQQQREDLYTQVKQASQQQAHQNYQTGLNSLRQQMQQQRLNMNQSRGQIAEQGAMQQRQIANQMQSKGLGSSGLRDLAGLQSQMAQGQAVNQLEQQNGLVQQEAMNTRKALSNELTNGLRAADLTYADQMVQSSEKSYQQEQQEKQYLQSSVLELANMLQQGSSSEDIKGWAKLMGIDIDTLDPATQQALGNIGMQNSEAIAEITGIQDETLATLQKTETGLGIGMTILGALAVVAGLGLTPFTAGASLSLTAAGATALGVGGAGIIQGTSGVFTGNAPVTYNLGGQEIQAKTADEAKQKLTEYYSKYTEVASGAIEVNVNKNGDVTFTYRGQKYKTLGEARQAVRNAPR